MYIYIYILSIYNILFVPKFILEQGLYTFTPMILSPKLQQETPKPKKEKAVGDAKAGGMN